VGDPVRRTGAGRRAGFTLLEVLVALALLAIVLAAALGAAGRSATDVAYLRDRTFASWVARDELTRRLLLAQWPEPGVSRGVSMLANRAWPWVLQVSATGEESLRRLDLQVEAEGVPLASLAGFALRPSENRSVKDAQGGPEAEPRPGRRASPERAESRRTRTP